MSAIILPAEYAHVDLYGLSTFNASFLDRYGLVGAAITAVGFLNMWQTSKVSRARKLAKIDYPQSSYMPP